MHAGAGIGVPLSADHPIATARLTIARLARVDAAELAAITDHVSITGRVEFLPSTFTVDDAKSLIASDPGFNAIRRRADGHLIGMIGTHRRGQEPGQGPRQEIEIGYWIGVDHRRQGYAREAVGAVLAALAGETVFAECAPENELSWQLLVSLGFQPSGQAGSRVGRQVLRFQPKP